MSEPAKVETMAKGDFARLIGVSPGRVSQYITEGKIFGDAIDGEGRLARIRPDVARAQLYKSLEPSQRLGGNGAAVREQSAGASLRTVPEPVHDELATERLKQQRIKTARAEREEALDVGRYMLTEAARREMGRAVAEAFKVMEQGLRDMANALSAEFSIPERDAQQVLQKSFRMVRAKAAESYRAQAEATPTMVEDAEEQELRSAS
ncbi:hypothetical protein R2G56_08385 [Nitratireductor aquimarinus]|uniref:Terminase small subunit n=1 Tax=Nitratireductor aquimarinus TaxID=889300 RepID=A0ABU4AJ89_9HYPH|nr:hypothetical protein [Nitratireductor aquimarinus]MDV6226301.1 hypothetical protein [Nitratireductor aquimarinus]